MATLPGLRVGLTLDSAAFIRETRRVQSELATLNRSFAVAGTAVRALSSAFGGLIGGLSVTALAQAGKNALDMAGGLKELAQQAGVTTRELQILQFAGTQFGVNSEQITNSLAQFTRRLGEAGQEGKGLGDTLRRYSISLTDAEGKTRSSYELFGDLAEAVQNASNQQEQATIAADAFGSRIGSKLLPLLVQGREGLDAMADAATRVGLILGDEFVAEADRASDALSAMQFAFTKGFQIGIVEEFAGAVSSSAEALTAARVAGEEFARVVGTGMALVVEAAQDLKSAFDVLSFGMAERTEAFRSFFDLLNQSGKDAQGFGDWLRELGLVDDDLVSINRRLVDLEETRRATVATMAKQGALEQGAAAATLVHIDEQIAALEQEKAELEDLAKQQAALDAAVKPTIRTLDQWTASLLGSAAAAKEVNREIEKTAAMGLADVELAASNLGVEEAKKEVQAFEQALEEKKRLSKQAANEAIREAEREAEEKSRRFVDGVEKQLDTTAKFHERMKQVQFDASQDAIREKERLEERARDRTEREAERAAERQSELLTKPFENAMSNIQNLTTDTFEQIYSGGITSFTDLANSVKKIFIRLAAEMTTLGLFRGVTGGFGGMFGAAGGTGGTAAQSFGSGFTTAGGNFIPAVASAPWWRQGALGSGGLALAGGVGALGGGLLGSQFGGLGSTTGALGGSLGAVLGGLTPFGPAGAIGGGILGSVAGGFLGSLFGGSNGARRATIGGGPLGGTGSGLAAQFGGGVDAQIQGMLSATQEAIVNRALSVSQAIQVEFNKDKGLSEGDKQRIAAARIGPAAAALGIGNVGAVTTGSAEQQVSNLQTAIQTMRELEGLRLGNLGTQLRDINDHFQELSASAIKYGIPLEGLAQAHQKAAEAAIRQNRAEFLAIANQVGAVSPLQGALELLSVQMQEAAARAIELGVPLQNLAATHIALAQAIHRQNRAEFLAIAQQVGAVSPLIGSLELLSVQMQEASARAIELGIPLQNLAATHIALAQAIHRQNRAREIETELGVGNITPLHAELLQLNLRFQELYANARQLGVATHRLAQSHNAAAVAVIRQHRIEAITVAEQVGAMTPLQASLERLNVEMQLAYAAAQQLGISTANISARHRELANALIEQAQATVEVTRATQEQIDTLALSITNPFKELLEPLRQLGIELNQSLMNPLEQFNAAAQNFRDVAHRAFAGSTEAIAEFDDAARGFIQTATQVGASPGQVAAIREVESARQFIVDQVGSAQAQAGRGVESAIAAASRREVDTLRELIEVGQQQIVELRRLTRNLT